ncbi:aminoglycoside phosphotransferase family protein [Alkalicoccobacillus porphyridii]|uniref:aminoglycoside phosphotransferase family protein n=1 Tax=Alkalicoccobacillus porphyridii TaxID=2597270 RepID=UPI0021B12B19|nr:phosphotransferase [Alkalicoccobacillus porphyridii]
MKKSLVKNIPILSQCTEVVEVKKGFSTDKKFLVKMPDRSTFLLRLFHMDEVAHKRSEFLILEKMNALSIRCTRPISIGEIENQGYMVTSYLEGEDAEEKILTCTEQEQFDIGFEAGKELKKMHQVSAPASIAPWSLRKLEKHNKYIDAYAACGIKIKNDLKIINFINENIHLMQERPNLFQHDDYHLGNIILRNKEFAGVIDFNRYDWGDPYHEFIKIGIFSRQLSIPFSKGQIQGYFAGGEPDESFWRLYSLYLAMCVFSTVVWTLKFTPNNMEEMLNKVYTYLDDHDYFDRCRPTWYE